ncbi:MAG: hypothetical protein WA609_09835, partial [Terriglobales bacterium]
MIGNWEGMMKMFGMRLEILLMTFGALTGLALSQTAPQSPTYLKCGWLLDGKSDQPQKDVVIAIDGETILS